MILIVVVGSAQSKANDAKIYFDYPPLTFKDESENVDKINEVAAENVQLLHGPRHNEFDWSLIKVSKQYSLRC